MRFRFRRRPFSFTSTVFDSSSSTTVLRLRDFFGLPQEETDEPPAAGEETEIIEGVEDEATWRLLRDLGCDLAQGFLISRPMQAEKVSVILRSEVAGTRLLSQRIA